MSHQIILRQFQLFKYALNITETIYNLRGVVKKQRKFYIYRLMIPYLNTFIDLIIRSGVYGGTAGGCSRGSSPPTREKNQQIQKETLGFQVLKLYCNETGSSR